MRSVNKKNLKELLDDENDKIDEIVDCCYLLSDKTRVKMILLLKSNPDLTTTEMAKILDLSASAVSHQKAIMGRYRLIDSRRNGQKICCSLLEKSICNEIVAIMLDENNNLHIK